MCEDMIYSNFKEISIYCESYDGECFDFGNCQNCKYGKDEKKMTIKEIRESNGLTQKQFAEHFDIPIKTIQNWEYGRTNPPDYVTKMIDTIINLERMIHNA